MAARARTNRERSKFGEYLLNLREQYTTLSQAEAARKLGLKNRQQLHYYEIGRSLPPTPILIALAQLYHVAPELLLEKAYWPQLTILPLVSLVNTEALSPDLVEALEKGLVEEERRELTTFVAGLLGRRQATHG